MPEIATFVPASFNAGDTVRWRMAPPGYSAADGWALECLFASASGTQQIGAAQDANGFTFTIAAAASAGWSADTYRWRVRARQGDDVFTVGEGLCVVAPALDQSTSALSPARRALKAVQDYLANPGNLTAASYSIAGRSLSRYSLPELWQHHDRLKQEVAREDAALRSANGLGPRGRVYVRFGR